MDDPQVPAPPTEALVPSPGPHRIKPGQVIPRTGKLKKSFARAVRAFLESKKKLDVDAVRGWTKAEQILNNMARIASSPKSPHAVAAATLLLDRAYGKAAPSSEELDALKEGGFRIVMVSAPAIEGLDDYKELPAPEPKFIDGEVIDE